MALHRCCVSIFCHATLQHSIAKRVHKLLSMPDNRYCRSREADHQQDAHCFPETPIGRVHLAILKHFEAVVLSLKSKSQTRNHLRTFRPTTDGNRSPGRHHHKVYLWNSPRSLRMSRFVEFSHSQFHRFLCLFCSTISFVTVEISTT